MMLKDRKNGNGKKGDDDNGRGQKVPEMCASHGSMLASQEGAIQGLRKSVDEVEGKLDEVGKNVTALRTDFAELKGELRGRRDTGQQ